MNGQSNAVGDGESTETPVVGGGESEWASVVGVVGEDGGEGEDGKDGEERSGDDGGHEIGDGFSFALRLSLTATETSTSVLSDASLSKSTLLDS